ncbi:11810_t:CDS:2, partial [Racocetra fulgida]
MYIPSGIENDVQYNITEIEARNIEYDAPRSQWREVMCSFRPINLLQVLGIWATTVMLIISTIRVWLRKVVSGGYFVAMAIVVVPIVVDIVVVAIVVAVNVLMAVSDVVA